MRVYELYYIGENDTRKDVFYGTCLYSEQGLRQRFKEAIDDGQFCGRTIDFYELDKPQDIDNMSIDLIAEIFEYDGYEIDCQEINEPSSADSCGKYTKGDCYCICEMLDELRTSHRDTIEAVAHDLGYEPKDLFMMLKRLSQDVDDAIGTEQKDCDYTEQMAEIMEINHIKRGM